MGPFDRYIENIAHAISAEDEARSFLEKDFHLIRVYIFEILRSDPIMGPLLIDSKYQVSNFNCSIILDITRFIALGVMRTQYPSFIKIAQRGRAKIIGMQDLPFFSNGENIAGGILTNIVKGLIAQGLDFSGYFVRGHLGDIYELEMADDTKSLDHLQAECDAEWQSNYILLNASTEKITIKIRLRVVVKFCNNEEPNDIMPYPTHNLKVVWLAVADVRYLEYFSLLAPLSERRLVSYPTNLIAMRLLFSLIERNKLYTLKKVHIESVSYELIYTRSIKGVPKLNNTVIEVIIAVLQRIIEYVNKNWFPFYWNTKENLLLLFKNKADKLFTGKRLREILNHIRSMQRSKEITCEEVESFFGVQLNSHIYNVDDLGIYKCFNKPS